MSEIKESKGTAVYNAVLYSDGGYHSAERAGGWGVHGYVFSANDLPTKGSGNPKSTPTADGYTEGKQEDKAVKVDRYVDQFGGVPAARSNNQTELLATTNALKYALEKDIKDTLIYSDSKYVVEGINSYLPRWKSAGYKKATGEEISNKEEWQAVDALLNDIRDKNNVVRLAWIKGHNGNVGNEMADQWATKGNCIALNGNRKVFQMEVKPDGYWKSAPSPIRILDQPKWYLSSLVEDKLMSTCGRHVYWTGDHGDDEDTGKPRTDSSNSVVYLKEPVEVLEAVRKHVVDNDQKQHGHIYVGSLRNIMKSDVTEDILKFGLDVFRGNPGNLSLQTSNKLPVLFHQTPTGLSFYNIGNLTLLQQRLDEFLAGDKSIVLTDLTDLLYEVNEKKGVETRKLRKEITNTVKHLDVNVNYNLGLARDLREMTVVPSKSVKVRLILGSDIIGRNALSALAESVKRVLVLSWRESDNVFRYATVIETEDDVGIWANPFGNFKLVK